MENKTLPEIENTINDTNSPTLFEAIKYVANKYKHNTNILLSNEELTIEYLVCKHYEQDVYKTINVKEFEDMLKVTILPERIVRIQDIKGLAETLLIIEKLSKSRNLSEEEINFIKDKYKPGQKIQLIKMYDFQAPQPNTIGIIEHIDNTGQIYVNWESGSTLSLNVIIDEFNVIE